MKLGESRGDGHRGALRCLGDATGTAVVEFALVVPLLLLIVFGILDFGRALNYWNDSTHLAATGARFAIVNKNPGSGSLADWIKSQGDTKEMRDNSTVCITLLEDAEAGDPVKVSVDVEFTWLPFIGSNLGAGSTTMSGTAVMRLERAPTVFSDGECSS